MNINFLKSHKTKVNRPLIWAVSLFLLLTLTTILIYATESTYNFVGVSQESNDYYAYEKAGAATFTNQDDTGDSEATNTDYDNIESSDGYYTVTWTTDGAATDGHYDSQIYKFYIAEDEIDFC